MTAWDLEDLCQRVDAVPKPPPIPKQLSYLLRVPKTLQEWKRWKDSCARRPNEQEQELAQLVCDGYDAVEAACVRLMNAVIGELESMREEPLEELSKALKEAGGPCNVEELNDLAEMFLEVTRTLRSQAGQSGYVGQAHSLVKSLISFLGGKAFVYAVEHSTEGSPYRAWQTLEYLGLSKHVERLEEAKRRLDGWCGLVCEEAKPPPSDVNTVKSAPLPMPVEQLAERGLGQLVWDGTCAAWGQLEAVGVAVMNDVTAELEAMREELLERLCQALHGAGGAGNDYASSLRKDMLTKVMESLSKQAKLIEQAERERKPPRFAGEHPFHATCVSAIDNMTALQQALPMEFYILQSSRPQHLTASDLQEMKEHLKEPLSASSNWGRLWEDRSWWEILKYSGLRFNALANADNPSLTPVRELIQVSQAIKDRRQGIREETAKPRAERHAAQKEIRELKARCDDLEERCEALAAAKAEAESKTAQDISTLKAQYDLLKNEHEALKSSLNAEASKAFAHRAWCGHGGLSSASPDSLSSWFVVASGSGGSQTMKSTSSSSEATSGPCCFLKNDIFKIKKEDGFDFCEAKDLQMGSQVVAENGEIIEVKTAPELHVVHEMVELQTESACLQVSPDHRIVRADISTAPWLPKLLFLAGCFALRIAAMSTLFVSCRFCLPILLTPYLIIIHSFATFD